MPYVSPEEAQRRARLLVPNNQPHIIHTRGGDFVDHPNSGGRTLPVPVTTAAPSTVQAQIPVDVAKQAEIDSQKQREAARLQQLENVAVASLLEDDKNFQSNVLSDIPMSNYHFRLFMTIEKDIVEAAGSYDTQTIYQAIDTMPKIIIAETGVTAGLNITSVDLESVTAPGWRTRSAYTSSMEIVITEPLGVSLIEAMLTSAIDLDVQNYNKFWYFLELTFNGYNDDGSINYNPCETLGLANGGRWIYQIAITNIKTSMSEAGAVHTMTCMPYSMEGFSDETVGRVPDNIAATGATMQEFCDDLAIKLTETWSERYAGEIFKFNIKLRKVNGQDGKDVDVSGYSLTVDDQSSMKNISFDYTDNNTPYAQIPRGTDISDVITFLFAHCEGAQQLMMDTSAPVDTEDEGGLFNGKKYRVAMVPMIEPDIHVTGYDPITGNYMKEITYYVWGFRTWGANLSPSQYTNMSDEKVASRMVQDLLDNNYLKKKYEYRFTGLNTEVINLDVDYNFAFSSLLPQLGGWRGSVDSSVDHAAHNEIASADGGSYETQIKESDIKLTQTLSRELTSVNQNIDKAQDALATETDEAKKKQLQVTIDNLQAQRQGLTLDAARVRANATTQSQLQMDELQTNRPNETFAEDFDKSYVLPYVVSYNQKAGDSQDAAGYGFAEQWHRGKSLVGALFNQMYSPMTDALINVTLDIRGDPYWLGYSSIERKTVLGVDNPGKNLLPNFAEGDNTFALKFKFPLKVGDDGNMIIRKDDVFAGVYRVTNIKSSFSGGEFKQTLNAIKLELIAPVASTKTTSNEGAPDGS